MKMEQRFPIVTMRNLIVIGPIYTKQDIPEENVEEFIRNMKEPTPWLKYVPVESESGKEGYVGMYYYVKREDASFPRSRP
jgi:hypothetical protein